MFCLPASLLFLVAVYSNGFISCSATKLPPGFPQCKLGDPKLNDCMKDAMTNALKFMKNGVPSLQLLPIDPLDIEHVDIQEGGNRPVNVKLSFSNAKFSGLSDVVFSEAALDPGKREITGVAVAPILSIEGDYVLDGKILQLPLKGKGKSKLLIGPIKARFILSADPETNNGEIYWNLKKVDITLFDEKNFQVNFENLFNGDKVLGEATNKALNENWQVFFQELKPALEQTFAEVFRRVGNVVFSKVPENDLFLK